ncbi:MAG: MOSC N-terminal beta barrel domain-containing protein [Planctomycetes bacterium]|nr:MOSC N-terminal beta barrel domain-containing protein [Planctomycetota bacterium]
MPHVTGLFLYPIKSLDRLTVTRVTPLNSGALLHDREYALFNEKGEILTASREPKLLKIRTTYDLDLQNAMFHMQGDGKITAFNIEKDRAGIEKWIGDFLGYGVKLQRDAEKGFHDETHLPGPVIIAARTLKEVHDWFPAIEIENLRRRVRPNIEMGGSLGFWEERLYSHPGFVIQFTVGKVVITGVRPAERTPAFEYDPYTGEQTQGFAQAFMHKRKERLPAFVPSERFDHYYKLGVRTRLTHHEVGKTIRTGERVGILERKVDAPEKE